MKNLSGQVGVYRRPNHTSQRLKLRTNPLIPINKEVGWWTVLENDLYKSFKSQTQRACLVRCRCGTERVVVAQSLLNGTSPSCGCKSRQRSIETVWNQLHNALKRRGWDFHLTLPQLKVVTQLPCAYCGKEPSNIFRVRYKIDGVYQRGLVPEMELRWSGLDRVDSTKGYIHGNVVPCCGECNGMKSKLPLDEFLALVTRIQRHRPTVEKIHSLAASLFDSLP